TADRFFSGSSIEANSSFELARSDQLFDGDRGAKACGSEQVVPAAVARRTGFQSLFHGLSLLGDARQRVVFAENTDNRPPLPVAGHKRRRHTRNAAFDVEALL